MRDAAQRAAADPGKLPRIFVGLLGNLDAHRIVHRHVLSLLLGYLANPDWYERAVCQNGHMREEVVLLEHQ